MFNGVLRNLLASQTDDIASAVGRKALGTSPKSVLNSIIPNIASKKVTNNILDSLNPLTKEAFKVPKTEAKPYILPKSNSADVTKLSDKDLQHFSKQGYTSITDKFGNTRQINPVQTDGVQRLDSLNPTGGVYVDYAPQTRATMPLADNMTTYDKTAGIMPDELVTIYRGAPNSQKAINPGDFITTNKELAESYTGDGNVLEMKVPARDILDDATEPLGEEYLYRPSLQAPKPQAPQPTSNPTAALKQEALKYKSVDEFLQAQGQPLYHGGAGVAELSKGVKVLLPEDKMKYPSSGGGYVGLSTSPDINYARQFSQSIAGHNDVAQMHLNPTAKVLELPSGKAIDDMSAEELTQLSKKYDAIRSSGDNEVRILNDSAVQTKQQLTDLYNQAHSEDMPLSLEKPFSLT